jgi:diguanylate cyclase (GGDEF)-like protein
MSGGAGTWSAAAGQAPSPDPRAGGRDRRDAVDPPATAARGARVLTAAVLVLLAVLVRPLSLTGLGLAAALLTVDTAAAAGARRGPGRAAAVAGALALAADGALALVGAAVLAPAGEAAVWWFAPGVPAWPGIAVPLLVLPVVEAAARHRLAGALLAWAALAAGAVALAAGDGGAGAAAGRLAGPLGAALVAGVPAGHLAGVLVGAIEGQRRAAGEARLRSGLLQRVAEAGHRVTRLDTDVLDAVVTAATGLGFRSVDVVEQDGGTWRVLHASRTDAIPVAALQGLEPAAQRALRRRGTVVVDSATATATERAALDVAALEAVVLAALDRHDDRPLLLRASVGAGGVLTSPQVEGFDLLAGHAGTALRNDALVQELKAVQRQLHRQAYSDGLTGLANRTRFLESLDRAVARPRAPGEHLAVLFLDLDRFKAVNDTLGHDVGNELLVAVAERVRACVRPRDLVARLGGDEFAVLLDPIAGAAEPELAGERIVAALSAPFTPAGQEAVISTSVGIAMDDAGLSDGAELLRRADLAMYHAKQRGRGRWQHWLPQLDEASRDRARLENDLRHALDRDELSVRYQPVLDLERDVVVGFEALLRWHHPQLGELAPDRFVPLAEDSGTIVDLGAWVLREVADQAVRLGRLVDDPPFLSVNVSPRQLQDPRFLAEVDAVLAPGDIDPARLLLEITERAVVVEDSERLLGELRERGVRLALDDFGQGQTSLRHLRRLPLDVLKIDRSIVTGGVADARDRVVLRSIVALGRDLGLTVVGEGVEDAEHATLLRVLGCQLAQGWAVGLPMDRTAVEQLVAGAALAGATGPATAGPA